MNKTMTLTEGRVPSVLVRFSIPFLLASLLQVAYGAADVFFIGKFDYAEAISGVSAGNQCMNLISSLFMGLTMGGTVLVGQYYGANLQREAAATIGNVIIVFAGIAAIATASLLVFGDALITVLQVPESAVEDARIYLRICAIGSTFIMGYNVVSSILRGLGNSTAPLVFVTIAFVIHIILDWILIVLIPMGAAGAAISTVISQGISLVISLVYLLKKGLPFAFTRRDIRLDKPIVKRIFKIGIPIALQNELTSVSFMIITAVTNKMGVVFSAGVGVVGSIVNFCMMIPSSLGSAISAISAQCIGAGRPSRAIKTLKWGIVFSLVFAIPFGVICQIWPEQVMSLMSRDQDVIREGAKYLIPYSWDCILVSFVFCMSGMFSGSGKTVFVMTHNLLTTFAVRIPIAYFMSLREDASLFHVGLGTPAATFVSLILCVIFIKLQYSRDKLEKLTIVS